MSYDKRHGGPYDRGGADYWYHRPSCPHYFKGASYQSEMFGTDQMTEEQIAAYRAGYNDAAERGDQKDWG